MENFDPFDCVERHRDVAVMMPRLRIVQTNAIDEHEHLAEIGAANGEIGLHAALATRPHVDRRSQSKHVGDAVDRQACAI